MYYTLYIIATLLFIPGIILGIYAQIKVKSTFDKYNSIQSKYGRDSKDFARYMLDVAGYTSTKVGHIQGELTDNYNPMNDTVSLSSSVYNSNSISALGVTAHEIGHVYQHKQKYAPIKMRNFLVPILSFSERFVTPLLILGIILEIFYQSTFSTVVLYLAVGIYALSTLFCLITLPVELNASSRAYKMLLSTGEMDENEASQVKEVLNAAALTYVASLLLSLLSLLRLLAIVMSRRD